MTATTESLVLTTEKLEWMYELMHITMAADERAVRETKSGQLPAAFYPIRGLEAVCAALGAAMEPADQMVSTYRNLGDALAKGLSLRTVVAEAYGRIDGISRGKGGTMHLADTNLGLMATTGIVGSGLPIAVGLGLAAQLDGNGRAVVVTFGDGATSIGAYHEAMNLAALWKLPVVFVCQNNQWAEHTPISQYAPNQKLAERAGTYGMKSQVVDGFDVLATWRVLCEALNHARAGEGPYFVECQTYRLTGHTGTADFSYVPKEELEAAMARDPVPGFRRWLEAEQRISVQRLEELEGHARAVVDDAFDFAQSSPPPDPEELTTDVFAQESGFPTS